ncbi:bis(5'-nucleosyl)-tetraphosphatase (symmetrical) YqeK [Paenibacillus alkalitolerans]|uniref:bis(5'-nucleosyl)-tetraphosphatase (symmetrical) YqeK n=1 Tax=Paenibacillus alkalitolerans TaxID=2799335 RepID=UPI0018F73C19|nr:bis(5'-nucleosyl)-tetraphosphatase (symmetrical) YqeK [Paenibacillus alkalitolerans]
MNHKELVSRLMASVERQMPAKRWKHTLGVVSCSKSLAASFGADAEKAEIAAILHDVAKFWPVERQREAILHEGAEVALGALDYDKDLWHAHAGAYAAKREYGIEDTEILDAIRYHTSGRAGMTLLEKVVCLADYIEPGRDFPGVEDIRRLAEKSLEKALLAAFDGTIVSLLRKRKRIYPLTVYTRNDLLETIIAREAEE